MADPRRRRDRARVRRRARGGGGRRMAPDDGEGSRLDVARVGAARAPVPRAPFLRRRGRDRRERVRRGLHRRIFFGATTRNELHRSIEFTETLALFLSFAVWSVFGALLVGPVLTGGSSVGPIAYAVLSLTLIRMIPVAISWMGLRLRPRTVLFAGWFGPRGLASVVFTMITIQTLHDTGVAADTIVQVATWTILLSVVAHGLDGDAVLTKLRTMDLRRRRGRFPNSRTLPSRASGDAAWRVARERHRRSEVVGEGGVEPPRPFGHRNLNPARLPIPPLAQWGASW